MTLVFLYSGLVFIYGIMFVYGDIDKAWTVDVALPMPRL